MMSRLERNDAMLSVPGLYALGSGASMAAWRSCMARLRRNSDTPACMACGPRLASLSARSALRLS